MSSEISFFAPTQWVDSTITPPPAVGSPSTHSGTSPYTYGKAGAAGLGTILVRSAYLSVSRSLKLASAMRFAFPPVLLALTLIVAVLFGDVPIGADEIGRIVLHRVGLYHGSVTWPTSDDAIIWQLRIPHVLAAAAVGMALAVAGALYQAVLRNPLADPYVIGASAGAQLGVSIALVVSGQFLFFGFGTVQLTAFAAAVATVLFVYGLARSRGRTPIVTLLLAGFVVSSFLISGTSLLMQLSGHADQIMRWTLGSGLDVSGTQQLSIAIPAIALAVIAAYGIGPRLDVVLLGEEQAQNLGVRVELLKLAAIILGALLTALAVALAGIIAFVGLIVPHTVRLIYGPSHRTLVPVAAIGGAMFVTATDLVARIATPPTPLPLGAVTAVIGAPFFLHLLRRSRSEYAL